MRLFRKRVAGVLGLLAVPGLVAPRGVAETPPALSLSDFRAELNSFQRLADACAGEAKPCDATSVPARQQVNRSRGDSFAVSWDWFSEALKSAQSASEKDRQQAMGAAKAHLQRLGDEAAAQGEISAEFGRARAEANAALRRPEFRATEAPSWLDREIARLQDWFLRLFSGAGALGRKAPWLAPLVEWSCFGLAAAGLLFFVQRSLRRQALRLSLSDGAALRAQASRRSEDWSRRAEEQAAAQQWRDAVRSLFWAGIAALETRRLWRADAARTPREYVRLLRPGSSSQADLRALTTLFERTWYGDGEGTEAAFREAAMLLQRLQTAKQESPPSSAVTTAAAGAL